MIYLAIFAVTVILLWLSGRCQGVFQWILVLAGLFLPCFIAGVRDETVGLDVLSYAKWMAINAQSMDFREFMAAESGIAAVGWNVFTWLSVKMTGGLPGYLFCIEALCIVPVYAGLHRTARGYEWLGMLMWLLLEYSFTLNGMRQSAAMGFVFLAVSYLLEHRDRRFVMWCLVGLLFHQTAVIGLLFWPLTRWTSIGSGFRRLFGRFSGMVMAAVIAVAGAMSLALGPKIVMALSVFKDSYRYQVEHLGENDFSVAGAYLFVVVLLLWLAAKDDFADGKTKGKGIVLGEQFGALCLLAGVGCLAWQLNIVSATLGRVGYYGTSLIPYMGETVRKVKAGQKQSQDAVLNTRVQHHKLRSQLLKREFSDALGGTCSQRPPYARSEHGVRMFSDRLLCGHGSPAREEWDLAVYIHHFGNWVGWTGWSSERRVSVGAWAGARCALASAGGC